MRAPYTLNMSICFPIWLIEFCIVPEISVSVEPFLSICLTLPPIVSMLRRMSVVASCSRAQGVTFLYRAFVNP